MIKVKFYDNIEDNLLKYAVIVARTDGKWVFCRHRDRNTWEVPGGHREAGENILDTARRELHEETGALDFRIVPVCVYSVISEEGGSENEIFGMLYYAEIDVFEKELHSEIKEISRMDGMPENWTYPEIQPRLIEEVVRRNFSEVHLENDREV